MKKTIVYIDGYNLYYGLLKGTRDKWLDLAKFSKALLREDHEIVQIKYFTAPIRTYPFDAAAVDRQKIYLQALSTFPNLKTILGFYSKNNALMPASTEECRKCGNSRGGFLNVMKLEEKRSDVNIATEMILDALDVDAEAYVLISGDSDFISPVSMVRKRFEKTVIVFSPHEGLSGLKPYASYYRNIPRNLPAQCQLPDVIPIGCGKKFIHKPETW